MLDGYQLIKTLGTGYTGTVKLGIDPSTQEKVAIKILDKTKPKFDKLV